MPPKPKKRNVYEGEEPAQTTQPTQATQAIKLLRAHGTPRPDEDEEEGEEAIQDSPPQGTQGLLPTPSDKKKSVKNKSRKDRLQNDWGRAG